MSLGFAENLGRAEVRTRDMTRTLSTIIVVLVVALAGCGGGDGSSAEGGSPDSKQADAATVTPVGSVEATDAARTFLKALDARDGQSACEQLTTSQQAAMATSVGNGQQTCVEVFSQDDADFSSAVPQSVLGAPDLSMRDVYEGRVSAETADGGGALFETEKLSNGNWAIASIIEG